MQDASMKQADGTVRIVAQNDELATGPERSHWRTTVLCLMIGCATAVQLSPFLDGWILTADDALFHYWAMTRPPEDWLAIGWSTALWKAKLGEFLSIPVMVAGNAAIESVTIRAANLAVFAMSLGVFALWLGRQFGGGLALAFAIVALTVTPLRFFHMPPTSYPFFPSLQVVLLMVCLLGLRARGLLGAVAFGGIVLAMLSSEYTLLLGSALILFEASREVRSLQVLVVDKRLWVLGLTGLVHIAFREFGAGNYTEMSGTLETGRIIQVVVYHTLNGTALGPAGFPFDLGTLSAADFTSAALAAGATGGSVLLAAPYLGKPNARTAPVLALVVLVVIAMTGPIALLEKYRDWCDSPSHCAYIDSRYAGWAAMIVLALPLQAALRRISAIGPAMTIGLLAGLTALQNASVAHEMRIHLEPWRVAERSVCGGEGVWAAFVESEVGRSVSFHETDGRTRADYWQAWADGTSCPQE